MPVVGRRKGGGAMIPGVPPACQNVNVAACRFYAKHCILGGVERYGYAACPEVAHEAMLLWYRGL